MEWKTNKYGKEFLAIEWSKDSKLVVVDLPRLIMIQDALVEHYGKNYVKCNNAFNRQHRQSLTSVILTNFDNFLNERDHVRWTIDKYNGNSFCIYIGCWTSVDNWFLKRICTAEYINDAGLKGSECLALTENKLKDMHNGLTWDNLLGRISFPSIPDDIANDYLTNLQGDDVALVSKYPNIKKEQVVALEFKAMQLPRMVWVDPCNTHRTLWHYNKADYSSAYPSKAGKLPTFKGATVVGGRANLDDYPEYDFAFYMHAHDFTIRNEDITLSEICKSEWMHKFGRKPLCREIPDNEEKTILMKSAEDITDVWEYFYDIKNTSNDEKEISEAKQIMVKTIGCFESITAFRHAFRGWASAVVYARHVKAMLSKIELIESLGGTVVQLATDCIGWIDTNDADISTPDKYLGAFHREHTDTRAYIKACGVYAIIDEKTKKILPPKLQGYQGIKADDIVLDSLEDLEEINSTQLNMYFVPTEYGYKKMKLVDEEIGLL